MVKKPFAAIIFLLASQLAFSACSLKNWWGEEKKIAEIAQNDVAGAECPNLESILSTVSDSDSERNLNCWTSKLENIWNQVEGENKNSISEAELTTLVRKGIVTLPGDRELTLKRLFTAKKLIGFPGPVTREKLDDWISWAKRNRPLARLLYRKFARQDGRILYADIESVARLAASALQKMGWSMDSHEFAHMLTTTFDIQDHDVRTAITPGAEVAINLINTMCPTFKEQDVWDTAALASCVVGMLEEFKVGAPWFEFLANPVNDIPADQLAAVQHTIDPNPEHENDPSRLTYHINKWFHQPNMGVLYPSRWTDLARRMGANPPKNLMSSLSVIRRFRSRSSEEAIYPEAAIRLYEVAQQTQMAILNGLLYYVDSVKQGRCKEPNTAYWTECVLADYQRAAILSPEIDTATRVKSQYHGQESAPLNGRQFSKIMFYHTLAAQVIDAFHDDAQKCKEELEQATAEASMGDMDASTPRFSTSKRCDVHLITTDLGDDNDKLVQLITFGVTSAQTIERFIGNIRRKLNHLPILKDQDTLLEQNGRERWRISGFARLVAMSSELLVKRSPRESNLLQGLIANLVPMSESSLSLDQLAVTAILNTVDGLPQYRDSYLAITDDMPPLDSEQTNRWNLRLVKNPETHDYMVSRSSVIKNLRTLLRNNFPRTYGSCEAFGFEKSCQLAFDHLISMPDPGSDYINASDLDILTIVATAMEGILDNCNVPDRHGNFDEKLSWHLLSGDDELDCGFNHAQAIVKRLIDSKILHTDTKSGENTKNLLNLINFNSITRIAGKVAMARGTTEHMILNIPIFWMYHHATIGSIYGLIADVADPDRARSVK